MEKGKRKITDSQRKAVIKYTKSHYDQLNLRLPKGQRDIIKVNADSVNESLNQYCVNAIDMRIESGK